MYIATVIIIDNYLGVSKLNLKTLVINAPLFQKKKNPVSFKIKQRHTENEFSNDNTIASILL